MKLMSFQNCFNFILNALQVKYTRRLHIDCILKKCKCRFYKAINDCLKKIIKIKIKKLPQRFITNISIDYNKKFLPFTINNLYKFFHLIPFPMEIILKDFCIKGKENCIKYILLSKVDDLYSAYIQSDKYKKEIELMKKEYGIKMTFLYQFVADNFLTYYYYSKPHKKNFKKFDMKIFNNNNLKKNGK